MIKIEIKRLTINDLYQLQKIGRATFSETFAAINTQQNMRKYLEHEFSTPKLTEEINDKNSEFYFATIESKAIGYLKINFGQSQTDIKDNRAMEIERIYVLKEYQGMKVGQVLFENALEIAMKNKSDYVWLGVWEKNHKAFGFYKRNGFVEFDKHIFKLGDDEQTDILMKLELKNSYQKNLQ